MDTFIFDKYGYRVEKEIVKEFELDNWVFKLEANQKNEQELIELNNFIISVDESLFKRGVRIIPSRDNRLNVESEYGLLSLVAVNKFNVSLNDLLFMHRQYSSFNRINYTSLNTIKELWINKVDNIENKILSALKIDNFLFEKINSLIIYTLGLGENAIDYLQDIILDYGDKIEEVTLSHKRFIKFDSYELLNPFNLIVDSPMRDIADLYNIDVINKENLEYVLKSYNLSTKSASLLFARILFPSFLFDLLEEQYVTRGDIRKELLDYFNNLEVKLEKIKYIHRYLVDRYGIRPLNWLLLE